MNDRRIKEDCPFCGCLAKEIQLKELSKGLNCIECPSCKATFNYYCGKQEIIDKWNSRYR